MYKAISRILIATMLWNTVAFAQTGTGTTGAPESIAEQPGRQSSYLQDPYYYDYRTGRRLVIPLDAPVDPDTYVVGPSDQFMLYVRGPREETVQLRVLPEGTIQLPNVGSLEVAGRTITQMRALIDERLEPFYRNVEIECVLVVPRTLLVYVLGEVSNPGPVELTAPFHLDKALDGAGGLADEGSRRAIRLVRGDEVLRTVDYLSFLRLGDMSQNPALEEGVHVFVPPRGGACSVVGEVWRGGLFEILEGETVADMVSLAGGLTPNAYTERMVLERLDENLRLSTTEFAYEDGAGTPVRDRDVIVVPDRRSFPGTEFVRVYGGGGRDGMIDVGPGETVASFLPRLAHLRHTFDLSDAVIERTLPSGEKSYIPVDLEAVLEGTDPGDTEIRPGDVISVPPYENVVFVVGNVMQPGPIDFQRGFPAERYITLAGGPSADGSIDRIEIITPDGTTRDGDRSSTVYRGETIMVKQKKSKIFQTVFISLTSFTSLILSIIAVSRN